MRGVPFTAPRPRPVVLLRALLHSALRRMKEAETRIPTADAAAATDVAPPLFIRDHRGCPRDLSSTTTMTTPPTTLPPQEPPDAARGSYGGSLPIGSQGGGSGGGDGGQGPAQPAAAAAAAVDSGNGGDKVCLLRSNGAVTDGVPGAPPPATHWPVGDPADGNSDVVLTRIRGSSSSASSNLAPAEKGSEEEEEETHRQRDVAVVGAVAGAGIDMEDLEAALDGFSAESLRGAGLFRSSVEWGDVGGLRGVRADLREILEVCCGVSRAVCGVLCVFADLRERFSRRFAVAHVLCAGRFFFLPTLEIPMVCAVARGPLRACWF